MRTSYMEAPLQQLQIWGHSNGEIVSSISTQNFQVNSLQFLLVRVSSKGLPQVLSLLPRPGFRQSDRSLSGPEARANAETFFIRRRRHGRRCIGVQGWADHVGRRRRCPCGSGISHRRCDGKLQQLLISDTNCSNFNHVPMNVPSLTNLSLRSQETNGRPFAIAVNILVVVIVIIFIILVSLNVEEILL